MPLGAGVPLAFLYSGDLRVRKALRAHLFCSFAPLLRRGRGKIVQGKAVQVIAAFRSVRTGKCEAFFLRRRTGRQAMAGMDGKLFMLRADGKSEAGRQGRLECGKDAFVLKRAVHDGDIPLRDMRERSG